MINKDTYKRFTNKKGDHTTVSGSNCPKETKRGYFCDKENCKLRITRECPFLKSFDRLAELEDKIMDGTLMELPCKVEDMIYNKNIKFYLNCKEIPFEELSKLPQMTVNRENHTITEVVLHYIDKDAIFFYTKTEHYTEADDADEEYYGET